MVNVWNCTLIEVLEWEGEYLEIVIIKECKISIELFIIENRKIKMRKEYLEIVRLCWKVGTRKGTFGNCNKLKE